MPNALGRRNEWREAVTLNFLFSLDRKVMADVEQAELLKSLYAHGEQFLQQFSLPKSLKPTKAPVPAHHQEDSDEGESEWSGIGSDDESDSEDGEGYDSEEEMATAGPSVQPEKPVVVFTDFKGTDKSVSKAGMREFMSSKISKLQQDPSSKAKGKRPADPESDEELSNAKNDALLHKLVHTKLLSGSLDPELKLTPAQRRKALEGRVAELAGAMTGEVKLGKGESKIRKAEHNRASKQVREGIAQKQRERQKRCLEEAKNIGTYHPSLKKLFEDESSQSSSRQNRNRGMKMGVGRFKGGILTLSKSEIEKVQGPSRTQRRQGTHPYKRK
ncbi:hypothetical protein CC1G_00233 [Coprinopsis cinerea okayama7|uniref:Uncharacterized protein n=1 Tax=Coprinopsis cinerea (strain Okayama-7 / 130 / ATCC MYA-4618 / FGSC 9003) TaxID=240176 RepID=A8NX86_COPC7|nr:hypothetical protein CC1G_00233 [Coprinopsis cinerea okayama7\|eukprot:XP_001837097.2 hypothetical protein CC1G_00233 [Coprinopsis cinerea okayama7\